MVYDGFGPETQEYNEKLKPGWHCVRVSNVVELQGGATLVVFENEQGECTEWIPPDVTPAKKGEKGNSAFRFWRLLGGFDYPCREWWETPPEERASLAQYHRYWNEEDRWPVRKIFNDIQQSGAWTIVRVEAWYDKNNEYKPSVEDCVSPARADGRVPDGAREPNGSVVLDENPQPQQRTLPGNDEVPF